MLLRRGFTSLLGTERTTRSTTLSATSTRYSAAVTHYARQNSRTLIGILQARGSVANNIRKALEAVVSLMTNGECRGCLVTNSIVELAPHDDEVAEVVRSAVNRMEKVLKATLDRPVDSNEISADTDTRAVARFFNCTLHGLVVLGKAPASKAALKDVVTIALSKIA